MKLINSNYASCDFQKSADANDVNLFTVRDLTGLEINVNEISKG